MKVFKKVTGWLHLWLGLTSGIVLIIVALTGALLTFEDELEPILFHQRQVVKPVGERLPADSLIKIANTAFKEKKVSRLIILSNKDRSVEARIGAKGAKGGMSIAYIDPYNGRILYKGKYSDRFFAQVLSLHRYLLLGDTGKIITGISCSICLFLVVSGIVLWWPANKNAMKQRFKIKWDAKGKRLNWDLHAVTGFYVSIFLVFVTVTGLIWSYDWAENLLFKLAGGKPEKEAKVKNIAETKKVEAGIYQAMFVQMNKLYEYEGQVAFNLPAKPGMAVTVQKEEEASLVRHVDAAYFDGHTGTFIKKLPFEKLSSGTRARRMVLPIHTGSLLGWPTKLLYLLVSLFTASLPVTGFLIWLGKNKKTKKNAGKARRPVKVVAAI